LFCLFVDFSCSWRIGRNTKSSCMQLMGSCSSPSEVVDQALASSSDRRGWLSTRRGIGFSSRTRTTTGFKPSHRTDASSSPSGPRDTDLDNSTTPGDSPLRRMDLSSPSPTPGIIGSSSSPPRDSSCASSGSTLDVTANATRRISTTPEGSPSVSMVSQRFFISLSVYLHFLSNLILPLPFFSWFYMLLFDNCESRNLLMFVFVFVD
jgi:hypothetical protein